MFIMLLLASKPITAQDYLQTTDNIALYLQALKLHINSKFLSFGLPILLIRGRPLTLLPLCLITGVIPA